MNATPRRQPLKLFVLVLNFCFVAFAAGQADAGCLDGLLNLARSGKSPSPAQQVSPAHFVPAVYRLGDASGAFLRVNDRRDDDESIVGLWQFRMDGPPAPDFGTQAWHSDGTELMFSAGRDPAKGDVCQGVWQKVGPRTYSLNHIAMGWTTGTGRILCAFTSARS